MEGREVCIPKFLTALCELSSELQVFVLLLNGVQTKTHISLNGPPPKSYIFPH